MKVYVVIENDEDGAGGTIFGRIEGVYTTLELAEEHEAQLWGHVIEAELSGPVTQELEDYAC